MNGKEEVMGKDVKHLIYILLSLTVNYNYIAEMHYYVQYHLQTADNNNT